MWDYVVALLGWFCAICAGILIAIWLFGAAFAGWNWMFDDNAYNRQLTNITYVQAAGVDPAVRYKTEMTVIAATEGSPRCIHDGTDVFNPGATDARSGPAVRFTFRVGNVYSPHVISVIVPMDKVLFNQDVSADSTSTHAVQFVYSKIVFAYDNNWDDLIDPRAGGMKGVVSRCLGNLSAGQTALIGLKRVFVYTPATVGASG